MLSPDTGALGHYGGGLLSPTVLHVAQPTVAGVAVVARTLASDQVERGWRVAVACPDDGHLARWVRAAGAEHLSWPSTRSPGPATIVETRRLAAIVSAARPDIVHLHSSKAGLAGRLAVRGKLATVFQPHAWSFLAVSGPTRRVAVTWERAATRWTHALAYVSAGERALGERAGISAHWVHTPNGVDLGEFRPVDRTEARSRLGLDDGPLALCLGRVGAQKGQDWLLRAWPQVLRNVADARLVLAGDPDNPADRLPSAHSVSVVGEVTTPSDWYAAADVVVIPSRWEGSPLVVREAMACARSVVMSDVPGAREDLPPGAGAIVPVEDTFALASRLIERLADTTLADEEGRAGRSHAAAHFDVRKSNERVVQMYMDLNGSFRA